MSSTILDSSRRQLNIKLDKLTINYYIKINLYKLCIYMSNLKNHMLIGSIAGLAVYGVSKCLKKEPFILNDAFAAAVIGSAFAVVPDVIEPANNPNHRSICHSLVAGTVLIEVLIRRLRSQNLSHENELLDIIVGGYLSHLILDETTPKGLPILFG